ncbi:hypothetical protein CHR90_00385 [Elstera cyanobacteriorum]|uniref:Novel STAND NTPase 1 domain-containing protein n=1 Tax=Elstera cyanobacteriorum TaxID=2022747 RepID=A0A255Y1J6_9PROT|nr:hypothetical protein CHR90_00385 [Elstera cyanobacteriorum]
MRASPETGAFTRRPAPLAALPPTAKPLIERLIDARLLVRRFSESAGESVVEVSHEALFRVWPLLADWLREERAFLQGKGRFDQSFTTWRNVAKSAKAGAVLSGLELDQNLAWLKERPVRFTPEETAYIHASDRARRAQRYWTRGLIGGIFAALLVGLAVSSYFYIQQRNAAEKAQKSLTAATETANGLIFDLAQKFKGRGLPNAMAREILDRARQLLERLTEGNEADPALQRSRVAALNELSHTLDDYGDPDGALGLARQGLLIALKLASEEPGNRQFQRDLSVSLERIGDTLGRSDPAQALTLYEEGLAIRRKLVAQEPGNTAFQRDLSVSLNKIGDTLGRSDQAQAVALYQEGLAIRRKLVAQEPGSTKP